MGLIPSHGALVADLLDRVRNAVADRYLVERELGRGAAAVVFLAEDRKHRRPVALKVLMPEVVSVEGTERFVREIETVARLNHPHILPLFDSGEVEGLPYFVMPYAAGESLRERLAREEQLPLEDALQITREVASALGYAHSLGIVHRDIKPANILLTGGHAVVADFGVARAISAAREPATGQSGPLEIIGTPMYMSPEQLSGAARLDGRSDLYSLGCVLYEMLAGRAPFAGPTLDDLRRQHLLEPVPSLRAANRDLPPGVEELVRMLLAKSPADRFLTAHQFVDRLPTPTRISSPSGDQLKPPVTQRMKRRRWLTAAAAASLLVVGAAAATRLVNSRSLDSSRYMVLGTEGALAGRESRYVTTLQEAVRAWQDVAVVSDLEVFETMQQDGEAPKTLGDALGLARRVGAGKLVRIGWSLVPDSIVLEAVLYDVASGGQSEQSGRVSFRSTGEGADSAIAGLAARLLLGERSNHVMVRQPLGTRFVFAARAYDKGVIALGQGQLDEAVDQFRRAVIADYSFSEALLLYAQTMWWRGDSATAWREAAAVVGSSPSKLTGERAQTGRALLALADKRYQDACREFDGLIAADSQDFTAWFGRGECHARDKAVVPDKASPSGWRFRSSYEAAISSYSHALRGIPSVHLALGSKPYEKVAPLYYVEWNKARGGWSAAPDSQLFAAWPALEGDTLAFVPWPIGAIQRGEPQVRSISAPRAVLRNRSRLAEVTSRWVGAFPTSSRAHWTRAIALEMQREAGRGEAGDEALAEIVQARTTAKTSQERVRAAVDQVRMLLKSEQFREAAELSDSLLRDVRRADSSEARLLSGVAALTGRADLAARLLRSASSDYLLRSRDATPVILPTAVAEQVLPLIVYSSFGQPTDSIRALRARAESRLQAYVPQADRIRASEASFRLAAALAFPELGQSAPHNETSEPPLSILPLQAKAAREGAQAVLPDLKRLEEIRGRHLAGAIASNVILLEARLWLQAGDTSGALQHLDGTLSALPTIGLDAVGGEAVVSVPQASALVRSMALRAEIAARDGDATNARRWAQAVVQLWSGADPALKPVVEQMKRLASEPVPPR